MKIIKDQVQLKECIKGAFNNSISWDHISYTQDNVIIEHMMPILTEWIITEVASLTDIEADSGMYEYWVQRAAARLMLYEYAKSPVELAPSGLLRTTTENKSTAFKYQEENYRDTMLRSAYNMMERAIYIMEILPIGTYVSQPYRSSFRWVPYATHMTKVTGKQISRWEYERMAPIMDDIDEMVISRIIPASAKEELISKMLDKYNGISPKQRSLIGYIQKAIANLSISEAVEKRWCEIRNGAVVTVSYSGDDFVNQRAQASALQVSAKIRSHNVWGSAYVRALVEFIKGNQSDFQDIYDYYTSNYPDNTSADDDCCCSRWPCCTHTKSGIVNL